MARAAGRAEVRGRILRRLRSTGRATVRELAAELGVSTVTVHRHLAELEREGVIARPRGAAQLLPRPARPSSDYADAAAARSSPRRLSRAGRWPFCHRQAEPSLSMAPRRACAWRARLRARSHRS